MSRDISIVFSAKDNFSSSLKKMIAAQREMEAAGKTLQQRLDTLNKTKTTLVTDFTKAKRELSDAKKALDDTAESARRLEDAQLSYDNVQSQLKQVTKAANETQKAIENASGARSKSENRAGGSSGGMLYTLGQAGAYKELGNLAAEAAGVFVQSAFGDDAATMLSSTLSGAASGAAIGTAIAPGIGTAIGAVVGGAAGAVEGSLEIFKKEDDAFKSVVQDRAENAWTAQNEALASGSATAAQREMDQIAFNSLFHDEDVAKDYLNKMRDFASVTPFGYEDLSSMSRVLSTFGYTPGEMLTGEGLAEGDVPLLQVIGDAGAALGMGASDMNMVATGLGRIRSSGKATLEYIKLLQERGIDAIGYLAEGMDMTTAEVYEAISKSLIDGAEAAECIANYMGQDFAGASEEQAKTYSGLLSTLEDVQTNLDAAMGEGYNEIRKVGVQDQIDYAENSGLEEDYKLIGQWKASLENEREQIQRDMLTAVKGGKISDSISEEALGAITEMRKEYREAEAEGSGAKMGEILARAQALAEAEYQAGEGYQEFVATQQNLINDVQHDQSLKDGYWNTGYVLGRELSKGIASAQRDITFGLTKEQAAILEAEVAKSMEMGPNTPESTIASLNNGSELDEAAAKILYGDSPYYAAARAAYAPEGYAYGLSRVPYDGYPALLHEGEQVLTAQEARSRGTEPAVQIVVNGMTVREEADIRRIAAELCSELQKAKAVMA